jgi:phenylacetate-CoA ligase
MWGPMKRLTVVARALRHARALAGRERWPVERREALQRERLTELVGYAARHSPYYREALADYDPAAGVRSLPALDKATMMERFDDLVTDRRLRRDELLAHIEHLRGDELYLDRYRAMTTSGSSGRKGLFVYDEAGWTTIGGQFLYFSAIIGTRPRVPRLRLAMIGGGSPAHMTRRGAQTLDVGLHRILSLPVTAPLAELVEALNRFRPDVLNAYPSTAVLLAEEQLAGRLTLSLRTMSTSSELRTPEAAARIEEAFGVRPFDLYATTEGLWGGECERHDGLHLFEEDVIWLPGAGGRPVAVLPMQFSVVARDRDVVEFQVVQEDARLVVLVVGRSAATGLEERVRAGLRDRLQALAVQGVEIDVRRRDALERSASGKLALVVADRPALATV